MAQERGSSTRIIIDQETTFKSTPDPTDAEILPFVSESLRLSRNLIESNVITGDRNKKRPSKGNYDISGDINLEWNPYMTMIIYQALGAVSTTGAGPYTHTFTVSDLPVGLCIEKQYPDLAVPKYFLYNGCKINQLKMDFKPEGIIDGSISVMGAKETVGNASFDATPDNNGHIPFDAFEASIEEGGATIAIISEINFTLENNLDGSIYVIGGSGERRELPDGMVKVSGTLKAMFEDVALYDKAIGHTESSIKIMLTKGLGTGVAGNEYLEVWLPEVIYQPQAPVISGPTGLFVELPFVAYYENHADATSIQIVIKNTQSSVGGATSSSSSSSSSSSNSSSSSSSSSSSNSSSSSSSSAA